MTDSLPPDIPPMSLTDAEQAASEILAMLVAMTVLQKGVLTTLQTSIKQRDKARLKALPVCDVPATQHRRDHRFGRPAKLDTDTELRAFVLARIDRLTYVEIADAIVAHFPPNRRVSKSSIHSWWNRPDVQSEYSG